MAIESVNDVTVMAFISETGLDGIKKFKTAKEKYHNLLTYQPEIIQRVSIQNIASYIGVSRETLSRIRSKIQ